MVNSGEWQVARDDRCVAALVAVMLCAGDADVKVERP